jgi:hypothetical protein
LGGEDVATLLEEERVFVRGFALGLARSLAVGPTVRLGESFLAASLAALREGVRATS